jgi:hypothetical protein
MLWSGARADALDLAGAIENEGGAMRKRFYWSALVAILALAGIGAAQEEAREPVVPAHRPLPPCGPSIAPGNGCIWQPANITLNGTDPLTGVPTRRVAGWGYMSPEGLPEGAKLAQLNYGLTLAWTTDDLCDVNRINHFETGSLACGFECPLSGGPMTCLDGQ